MIRSEDTLQKKNREVTIGLSSFEAPTSGFRLVLGEINVPANRLVLELLFRKGRVHHPICSTYSQGTAWPATGARTNGHDFTLRRPMDLFRSTDRRHRS